MTEGSYPLSVSVGNLEVVSSLSSPDTSEPSGLGGGEMLWSNVASQALCEVLLVV